jgi:hypothetical protein
MRLINPAGSIGSDLVVAFVGGNLFAVGAFQQRFVGVWVAVVVVAVGG